MHTVVRIVATLLVAALFIGIVNGCSRQELPDKKIDQVVRVLMHEPGRYTFLNRIPDSKELESTTIDSGKTNVSIIEDVPENNEMWVNIKRHSGGGGRVRDEITIDLLEIHIHSANDVNGAGWNHGKFGRGQTTVVE